MSLFSKILDKLGLRKEKEEEKPAVAGTKDVVQPKPTSTPSGQKPTAAGKPTGTAPVSNKGVSTTTSVAEKRQQPGAAVKHDPTPVPAPAKTMPQADVMNMLEQKATGTGLNWKQSISDLLFLLDIDNSYEARVELAKELNAPQEVMGDSARMNTWLHKEVLRKIAENGGNIPQELLD
jgi:hypothetical protein